MGSSGRTVAIDPNVENLEVRCAFARAGFVEDAVAHAKQVPVALMVFGIDTEALSFSESSERGWLEFIGARY